MYRSMLETAENSEGSAMIENEKYMQSFEARINLLRVELEKLIVVVGEAFLTDGMLAFIQMAGNVLNIIAEITKTFGALPVLLGTGAVALTALSKRFRDLTTAIYTSTKSLFSNDVEIRKLTVSTAKYNALKGMSNSVNIANNTTLKTNSAQMAVLSATTQTATVATSKFGNALRGLALATGAGVAFVAVGFVLEKLIGGMGGAIEKSDELASANRILLESYSNNETEIDSLAVKYSELEKEMKKANPDSKKVAEYHDVMNQLGNLLPDLVTGEDQFGNKIIASSTATEIKIGLLKEQLEIQKELNAEQERADTLDSIDTNSKAIEKAQKKTEDYIKMLTNMLTGVTNRDLSAQYAIEFTDSDGKPLMKSGEDIAKFIDDLKVKLSEATKNGDSKDVSILNSQISQMERYYAMIDKETRGVSKNISMQKSEYIDLISQTVAGSKKMSDSAKNYADSFVASMLKVSDGANVDALGEGLNKLLSSDKSSSFVSSLSSEFNKLDTATEETFDSMSTSVQSFIDNLPQTLIDSGLNDAEIKVIQTALQSMLNSSTADFNSFEDTMKSTGITLDEARRNAEAAGDGMSEMGDNAQKAERDIADLTDSISYINGVLEDYAESNKLSASTVMELIDKYPQLIAYINDEGKLIEELTKIRDQDISAAQKQMVEKIEISEEYYNANLKMIESYFKEHFKFYNGDLTQFKNIAEAKADVEKQLIQYLAKEWSSYYDTISKSFIPVMGKTVDANQPYHLPDGDVSNYPNLDQYSKKANEANRAMQNISKELDKFTVSQVSLDFTKIGTSLDKNTKSAKKSDKATKDSTETVKNSTYYADKYAQALEKINLEIAKQENLRKGESVHSEKYRKSLEAQIKLEEEKLRLNREQQASLKSQIASGKIQETGIVTTTSKVSTGTSKSTTIKPKGWSGKVTSAFGGKRNNPEGYHTGIDLDGAIGDLLQSNIAGKVIDTGKNSRSGNYVKIKSSDGNTHYYVHLDSIKVEKGQAVSVGTNIGTIGNTGNVVKGKSGDGSHLHYEVRNSKGTPINPTQYVNNAKKGVTTSKQVISEANDASQVAAETQARIARAKSELSQLQLDELAYMETIASLQNENINSALSWYDYKQSQYDASLSYESTKLEELDINSARYTATLGNMIKFMNKKQSMNKQEQDAILDLINSGKFHGEVLDGLKDRYAALNTEMKATQIEIKKTNYEFLMNIKAQSDQKIGDIQYEMDRLSSIQGLYEEGSGDWVSIQEDLIDAQKRNTAETKSAREELQKEITARSLNAQEIEDMRRQLQGLSIDYWNSLSAEKAMTKALEDSQKAILSNMADDIINAYKDVYSEKQDIHMESLESERRAEEKAHQARMKEIEDEMNLYRKSVQEKIDLINKQESERDYNMEVSEMEAERTSVAKKLNEVQFDNSHEGKAERKKLQEQLDKIDKDIAEKRHDRDIQLQTDALNEMLELKEEESQGMQDIETSRYETEIDNIDRQKEYWGKYYNDLINDERKFAKLREDIMNKNFDNIEKEFGEFIGELNASLPSLEDTMDGTMGAVGTSIRVNIIDNLQRALDMLAEFESKQEVTNSHNTMGSGSTSSPTGSGKSSLSNGDMQVLLGKFMTEQLANEETDAKRKATIKNKAYEIASSGRKAGSTIGANESLQSVVSGLSKEDKEALSAYISSRAGSIVSTPALQDYIRNFVKLLLSSSASLSVGGMIPRATGGIDGKGGRSVIVHPEEIISNPIDSKNMVITSSIMERVASMLTLPKLNSLISSSNGGNGVEINFNIDKMYGTEQEANGILSKINTTMKTRFGGGL